MAVVDELADRVDPATSALIVVDVQVDFCRSPGSGPEQIAAMEQMSVHLERLIDRAHVVGVPVIFIQTIHDRDSDSTAWRTRHGSLEPYEHEPCKPGTPGAEFFRVAPRDGDVVVVKHRYDAFVGTDLAEVLGRLGTRSVIMTGVMTDICVETTLRHAMCLDFRVTVVSDCCESVTRDRHATALARIAKSFGLVADSNEIAELWNSGSVPHDTVPAAAMPTH